MASAVEVTVNGAPATADDLTHAALVNYGAYTSFKVEQGCVRGLDLHLARLEAAAVELFGESVGEARLRELMRVASAVRGDCWLRVSLFSTGIGPRTPDWFGRPNVMIATSPLPAPLAESVRLQVQTYARVAPHLKHVATFGLIRARRAARMAGFDDALFVDVEGAISEGSLWNIGFFAGEEVIWPQAPMLAGVTQVLIQRELARSGLTGRTAPVHLEDLARLDGAFICNSATPACAVAAIGEHAFMTSRATIARLKAAWASNPVQPI